MIVSLLKEDNKIKVNQASKRKKNLLMIKSLLKVDRLIAILFLLH